MGEFPGKQSDPRQFKYPQHLDEAIRDWTRYNRKKMAALQDSLLSPRLVKNAFFKRVKSSRLSRALEKSDRSRASVAPASAHDTANGERPGLRERSVIG